MNKKEKGALARYRKMVSKGLSIFADIIAILLLWVKIERLPLWLRIVLSFVCLILAAFIVFREKGSNEAKVTDYYCENGLVKHVFIQKNSNFKENTLVSVNYNRHGQKKFSAIGYVVDNNDGSFQIIIVKIFDKCIHQIGQNPKNYKDFAVSPSLKYSDTESLFYAHAQKGGN